MTVTCYKVRVSVAERYEVVLGLGVMEKGKEFQVFGDSFMQSWKDKYED